MFDEKYMKSQDKPLETVEDALAYVFYHLNCSGVACSNCGCAMYGAEDGRCAKLRRKAGEILGVVFNTNGKALVNNGEEGQKAVYEAYCAGKFSVLAAAPAKSEETSGTCEACIHSVKHSSGILFCKSFGNFTHADGHCYRYEPKEGGEQDV